MNDISSNVPPMLDVSPMLDVPPMLDVLPVLVAEANIVAVLLRLLLSSEVQHREYSQAVSRYIKLTLSDLWDGPASHSKIGCGPRGPAMTFPRVDMLLEGRSLGNHSSRLRECGHQTSSFSHFSSSSVILSRSSWPLILAKLGRTEFIEARLE